MAEFHKVVRPYRVNLSWSKENTEDGEFGDITYSAAHEEIGLIVAAINRVLYGGIKNLSEIDAETQRLMWHNELPVYYERVSDRIPRGEWLANKLADSGWEWQAYPSCAHGALCTRDATKIYWKTPPCDECDGGEGDTRECVSEYDGYCMCQGAGKKDWVYLCDEHANLEMYKRTSDAPLPIIGYHFASSIFFQRLRGLHGEEQ